MAELESRNEKRAAGATERQQSKGKVLQFCLKLKKEGYSENTIHTYMERLLRLLDLGANLTEPEHVKEILANQKWDENTKLIAIAAYTAFLEHEVGITWKKPRYKKRDKIPYVPTEEDIDCLIAGSGRKLSTFLQLLKETGTRCGEAIRIEWRDLDFKQRIIRIEAEKGSNPRILPISGKLAGMLQTLPKTSKRVYPGMLHSMRFNLQVTRKRLARKLNNPRLLQVNFHSIRHWKGTNEYHKTKDILHVKQLLGHKNIKSTLVYINIENALFQAGKPEDFHVKVAKTPREIKSLLEIGFEWIGEKDGLVYLRKRR